MDNRNRLKAEFLIRRRSAVFFSLCRRFYLRLLHRLLSRFIVYGNAFIGRGLSRRLGGRVAFHVRDALGDVELGHSPGVRVPVVDDRGRRSRFDPLGPRRRRFHYGLDLAMPTGEPIYAAFDGVVRFSKYNRSYGHLIVIRHDNGLETYYAHLSKRHVAPGTRVRAGEEIGLCGNTGRSRGSHLHFEIRYNGNAINPEDVISCETRTLIKPMLHLTKDSFRKVAKRGYSNQSPKSRVGNYSNGGKTYKIRTGDTLSRIAKRNGTTVKKLCQLNGLKETSVLKPGRTIRIR